MAAETPEAKPRIAAMRMMPRVSAPEIQALVQELLAAQVLVKTDGGRIQRPGQSSLPAGLGRSRFWPEAVKVLPWVHTLIANVKGNSRSVHHGVSQETPSPLPEEVLLPFNRGFLETQMFTRMLHACLNSAPSLSRS